MASLTSSQKIIMIIGISVVVILVGYYCFMRFYSTPHQTKMPPSTSPVATTSTPTISDSEAVARSKALLAHINDITTVTLPDPPSWKTNWERMKGATFRERLTYEYQQLPQSQKKGTLEEFLAPYENNGKPVKEVTLYNMPAQGKYHDCGAEEITRIISVTQSLEVYLSREETCGVERHDGRFSDEKIKTLSKILGIE